MDIRCHILPLMHIGRCGTVKNIGAWAGKSRYLTFVDSDDTIEPTALEEVMAAFNEQKVDIVYTDQIVVDGKGGEKPANNTGVVYSQEMMLTMRCIKQLYVIEREIFTKLNGHDPTFLYAADYDLVIRASEIASVYHLQRPLYRYLISQDHEQISNQHKQLQTAFAYRARLAGYLRRKIVPPKEVFLGAKMGQDLG